MQILKLMFHDSGGNSHHLNFVNKRCWVLPRKMGQPTILRRYGGCIIEKEYVLELSRNQDLSVVSNS